MAYNKKTWLARLGQGLNKFIFNGGSKVTLDSAPDVVSQQGTPLSADNMNDLEQRIKSGFDDVDSAINAIRSNTAIAEWQSGYTYAIGDYCMHNGYLYRSITNGSHSGWHDEYFEIVTLKSNRDSINAISDTVRDIYWGKSFSPNGNWSTAKVNINANFGAYLIVLSPYDYRYRYIGYLHGFLEHWQLIDIVKIGFDATPIRKGLQLSANDSLNDFITVFPLYNDRRAEDVSCDFT